MKRYLLLIVFFFNAVLACAQPEPNMRRADSLYLLSQYKEAIPFYTKSLKAVATNALGWTRLGYSYHQINELDKAEQGYTTALQNNPQPGGIPIIYSRLAKIYSLKKNPAKSFEWLDKAVAAGFGNYADLTDHPDFASVRGDKKFNTYVERARINAFPCLSNPKMREFDFWLGEWDVFQTQNLSQKVGENTITIMPGGCSLLESWVAMGAPNVGQSINFYDPGTGKWEQLWVGSGGQGNHIGRFRDGVFENNALRFTNEQRNNSGQVSKGRFTFTKIDDNTVTQHLETSADGGVTFTTVYNFTYKRKKKA